MTNSKTVYVPFDRETPEWKMADAIRKEGTWLEREDTEKEDGFYSCFFIEWQGDEYMLKMKNGEYLRFRKLWSV